jgi:hypothetical protein
MSFKTDALQDRWAFGPVAFGMDAFRDGWLSRWLLLELDGLQAADLGETLENRQFGDPAT